MNYDNINRHYIGDLSTNETNCINVTIYIIWQSNILFWSSYRIWKMLQHNVY